jgi:hypothetical protein
MALKGKKWEMSRLTFNEELHEYRDVTNGDKILGVSSILSLIGGDDFSKIPEFIMEKARLRGTTVHNALETYIEVGADSITPKDNYFSHYYNIKKMMDDNFDDIILCEQQVYYESDRGHILYCGTMDFLGRLSDCGTVAVGDFKTSSDKSLFPHKWALQLALYSLALENRSGKLPEKQVLLWSDGKSSKVYDLSFPEVMDFARDVIVYLDTDFDTELERGKRLKSLRSKWTRLKKKVEVE